MRQPPGIWPSGSGRPRGVFDLATKEARVAELDARAIEPGFWDDQRSAQKVVREAEGLRVEIALWRSLEKRAGALEELIDLLPESPAPDPEADLRPVADTLRVE